MTEAQQKALEFVERFREIHGFVRWTGEDMEEAVRLLAALLLEAREKNER